MKISVARPGGASPMARVLSPRRLAIVLALAVVVAGAAFWSYRSYQKHALQTAVLQLVREASRRAQDALDARATGADALRAGEARLAGATAAVDALAALEGWRDAPLAAAAGQYLDEVQALLRREIALRRSAAALRSDVASLTEHVRAAGGRSSAWIERSIALKRALDRDFFDYRLAAGGLQKSLRTLREARDRLAPLVPAAALVDDGRIAQARSWLEETSAQLQREAQAAGTLPMPRH